MLTYVVFLFFLTKLILDNTRMSSVVEETSVGNKKGLMKYLLICMLFVISFLSVEVNTHQVTRYNFKTKLRLYLQSGYNQVDLFAGFSFLLYAIFLLLSYSVADQGERVTEPLFFAAKFTRK